MVGIGCFYLHNTPLDSGDPRPVNRRASMFSLCERLFDLPLQDRLSIDVDDSRHFRGYCKFGDERTLSVQDHRDQFDYGRNVAPLQIRESDLKTRPYLNLFGPNQFLDDAILPGHQEVVTDWFETANEICKQLTRAVELASGVQEGRMSQYLDGNLPAEKGPGKDEELDKLGPLPFARMKTIRYPAGEVVDGVKRIEGSAQGVGAHKDSGWLTLLSTSSVGGLEAQDFDGKWLSVPYVKGSTIVNFGQQVEFLTGGIVQAANHRVVIQSAVKTRYSVAWLSYPALNALLKPLDVAREFSDEVLGLWKEAEAQRQGKGIVTAMPKFDLSASQHERFGWLLWRRRVRSHPVVAKRFYALE
ncbi:hypothetical protein BGZ67_004529 [Mortierella alpina]|nr:hypothetical protein BGZ67_004529 [Mortierella alpina]